MEAVSGDRLVPFPVTPYLAALDATRQLGIDLKKLHFGRKLFG
jgi:hypothetical protein